MVDPAVLPTVEEAILPVNKSAEFPGALMDSHLVQNDWAVACSSIPFV